MNKYHQRKNSCHGKYDSVTSSYAYYATEEWPYLVNCFGPGVGIDSQLPYESTINSATTSASIHQEEGDSVSLTMRLPCRDGYYRQLLNQDGLSLGGVGVGESPSAVATCRACPAGRFGSVIAGGKGGMKENCPHICPLGHYCPLGSSAPIKCPAGRWGGSQVKTNLP
jgi:hypothetical protein